MADRPILFSGPMVRALLDGRKTQTRRVLNPQPEAEFIAATFGATEMTVRPALLFGGPTHMMLRRLPRPGDRLWTREAHAIFDAHGQHRSDGKRWGPWGGLPTQFSADQSQIAYFREGFDRSGSIRWRPSIHMPRWASRLTLIVTEVRVERLQDISDSDAIAEGVEMESADPPFYYVPGIWPHSRTAVGVEEPGGRHAARSYAKLWNELNAARGFGWDANPFVIAITIDVHKRNIDETRSEAA